MLYSLRKMDFFFHSVINNLSVKKCFSGRLLAMSQVLVDSEGLLAISVVDVISLHLIARH